MLPDDRRAGMGQAVVLSAHVGRNRRVGRPCRRPHVERQLVAVPRGNNVERDHEGVTRRGLVAERGKAASVWAVDPLALQDRAIPRHRPDASARSGDGRNVDPRRR